jgi:hypothetical protein
VSQAGQAWEVVDRIQGWTRFRNKTGEVLDVPPQVDTKEVVFLEPTEAEALLIIKKILGGEVLSRVEALAVRQVRANETPVAPFPKRKGGSSTLQTCRTHISLFHGVYVDDVETVADMNACHDWNHTVQGAMMFPHHHLEK